MKRKGKLPSDSHTVQAANHLDLRRIRLKVDHLFERNVKICRGIIKDV